MKLTALAAIVVFAGALMTSAFGAEPAAGGKTLYHVVTIKVKEGAEPEKVKAAEEAFAALKTKIPGIKTLHWGTNVSPEKKNMGFTHCFVLTFGSDADRDAYLVHPDHKAFGKVLGPVLAKDGVLVIDFWSND